MSLIDIVINILVYVIFFFVGFILGNMNKMFDNVIEKQNKLDIIGFIVKELEE